MPATELLCNLAGVKPHNLSREESIIIEAELFTQVCKKLNEVFIAKHKSYLQMLKFDRDKEIKMLEENFTRCIINDILATEEYTLTGIAYYTQTPEEVVFEIVNGTITNPSVLFFRKVVELHKTVRHDLYKSIMEKIISEYSEETSE
jgi:hypothetical protein